MSFYSKKELASRRESDPELYMMAACSVYPSYTSSPYESRNLLDLRDGAGVQRGSTGGAGGYIRDDIMFTQPRCSTPSSIPPRSPRHGPGVDAGFGLGMTSGDRRATILQDYFKSTNALNRSIMLEKSTVENQHGPNWPVLSDSKRDEIVDEHFVPSQVRDQYDDRGLSASGRSRTLHRRSSSPMSGFLTQDSHHHYEDIDGLPVPLSQPITPDSKTRVTHRTLSHDATSSSSSSSSSSSTSPHFSRNKMMSFSIRSKKVSPVANRRGEPSIDFLPLFERDVNDIDNEIDLPDESLINDHVDSSSNEESFTRLRPLRYSFGRKLRNKVNHTQSTNDLTITNMNTDSPSLQDLRLGSSTLDLTDLGKATNPSPDPDPHALMSSPMSPDDTSSMLSSQHSLVIQPEQAVRGKAMHRVMNEGSFKHPLSRSVRAGSKYMTVTSEMADRRQMFKGNMSRKAKSENNTRENTPVPDEVEKKGIPLIKTESFTETEGAMGMSLMSTTAELISPMTSPPGSPAAHGPHYSKRESGYISSYGENEASDDDEATPSRNYLKTKKRSNRTLNIESSPMH